MTALWRHGDKSRGGAAFSANKMPTLSGQLAPPNESVETKMRPTLMLCSLPIAVLTAVVMTPADVAQAQALSEQLLDRPVNQSADQPENPTDEATPELPADAPLDLSMPDNGKLKAINPFAARTSTPDWSGKVGVDARKPAIAATEFQPEHLTAGAIPDQSTGVAWANVTAPGLDAPLGWDKTSIDTRLDPSQEQGKLGTTLSRSVPVGENFSVTLQNGVAVTRTLPSGAQPPSQSWASSQAVRFNILPTDTTLSVGANISTTDDKWLRTLSAEQKLFGGPVSITGTVSETPSGEASKSLKAGFKRTW